MSTDSGDRLLQPTKRVPRRMFTLLTAAVVIVVVVAVLATQVLRSSSAASTVAGPTAVPTLDFFRGKSYPTQVPQQVGAP